MTQFGDMPSAVTRVEPNSKQAVDSSNKAANGKSFSNRFKFGGKGTKTSNCLKISMNTTSAVKVTVYAMCSSDSKTGVVTALGSGDGVELLSNSGTELKYAEDVSVTPDSEGNIYIYATGNAMNIYYLEVNP